MARKSREVESEDTDKPDPIFELLQDEVDATLRTLDKKLDLTSIVFASEQRAHTGLLCLDLMTGGGIAPGMYVFAGPEQSAKTTAAITIAGATCMYPEIRVKALIDAENSSGNSLDYIANIFETQGFKVTTDELFGVRDNRGKYSTRPKVIYSDNSSGDTFYNWMYGLLRRLPDKRFDRDRWWYVYDDTTENKKTWGPHADKRQGQLQQSGIWVPATDGSLQALVILDSLPSLVPAANDDDEASNAMAVQARMHSQHLPRIKGMFRAKRCALIAINQIRVNPGARFSNPEYEPGGNAVAFFSDARYRFFPRSLSGVPFHPKGEGQIETEASLDGGKDVYRYIHVGLKKNKLSAHVKEMWLRLWVSDSNGEARGYDPVWDTFWYGFQTGQITGNRKAMRLRLNGLDPANKDINWSEFKMLVLGDKKQRAPIFEKIGHRNLSIRGGFLNQVQSGRGYELFFAQMTSTTKTKTDEE